MLLEKYLLVGMVLAMIFVIVISSNPGVSMFLQRFLPQNFSDRKTFRKAVILIIVAWPAMAAYLIIMAEKRK